ncbi:MAG: ABC transporter substrate-binding protein [Parcubacteria group bacterium]|nr:ABC transporter substrate-binding protein [Parcubacteria group bacterium]
MRQVGLTLVVIAALAVSGSVAQDALGVPGSVLRGTEGFAQGLTPVALRFSFFANVEFIGYYRAQKLGYFEEEGLDVTLLNGSGAQDVAGEVDSGGVEFGLGSGVQVIEANARGIPIQAIFGTYQRTPFGFATLTQESLDEQGLPGPEITDVQGFLCRRIGVQTFQLFVLEIMLASNGLTLDDIRACGGDIAPVLFDLAPLVEGSVDAFLSFVSNEPVDLALRGITTNFVQGGENGVLFYESIPFARRDFIEANPDIVQRFVNATARGFREAFTAAREGRAQELVNQVIYPEGGPFYEDPIGFPPEKEALGLEILANLALTSPGGREMTVSEVGIMEASVWEQGVRDLIAFGQINENEAPPVENLFTTRFLAGAGVDVSNIE